MITRDEINRILILANDNGFYKMVYGNGVESNGSVWSCSITAEKAITIDKLREILETVIHEHERIVDTVVELGHANPATKDMLVKALNFAGSNEIEA